MDKQKHTIRLLCLLLFASVFTGLPAHAIETTTSLTLLPQQQQAQTGQTVALSVFVEQSTLPLAGASLTFTFSDGYQFDSVTAGSGIDASEFSYSYLGDRMVLLYLDNDNGNTPAQPGTELAQVTVKALKESNAAPLLCTESDIVGAQGEDLYQMDAEVTVGVVTVTGATVTEEAPAPHYSDEGQEKQEIAVTDTFPAGSIPEEAATVTDDGTPQVQTSLPADSTSDNLILPGDDSNANSGMGNDTANSENVTSQPMDKTVPEPVETPDEFKEAQQEQRSTQLAGGMVIIGMSLIAAIILLIKGRKK